MGGDNPFEAPREDGRTRSVELPERPYHGDPYLPCPRCKKRNPHPVGPSWWGGYAGGRWSDHVECSECGTGYDGRTGVVGADAFVIYYAVAGALLVLGIGLLWFLD
jgi:hypothetical protein